MRGNYRRMRWWAAALALSWSGGDALGGLVGVPSITLDNPAATINSTANLVGVDVGPLTDAIVPVVSASGTHGSVFWGTASSNPGFPGAITGLDISNGVANSNDLNLMFASPLRGLNGAEPDVVIFDIVTGVQNESWTVTPIVGGTASAPVYGGTPLTFGQGFFADTGVDLHFSYSGSTQAQSLHGGGFDFSDLGLFPGDSLLGVRVVTAGGDPSLIVGLDNDPGLLNVVPGASAAYSLRLLDDTYAGFAIQVRRSSDGAVEDIGFSFGGLLDTEALTAFVGTGNGYVTTWYDQSGNSLDLGSYNTGVQPQIMSGGTLVTDPNGNVSLFYDGSAALFRNTDLWSAGETGVFSVGGFSTDVATGETLGAERFFNFSTGDSTRLSQGAIRGSGGNPGKIAILGSAGAEIPSSESVAPGRIFQSTLLLDDTSTPGGDTIDLLLDRSSILSTAITFSNLDDRFTVGAQTHAGGRGLEGWLSEIVVYNTSLTGSQIDGIALNQMDAFGIVPEPSTAAILFAMFSACGFRRRRRIL